MNISTLLLIFYVQWFFYDILFVDSTVSKSDYYGFIKQIVNHVRFQHGWNPIYHLEIFYDKGERLTIENILKQNPRRDNVAKTFNAIVNLINYKYDEVVQTFVKLIIIFIDECKSTKSSNDYINCAIFLEIELTKSLSMLECMYKVLTFFSYLDLKYATNKTPINSHPLIEEIHDIKAFISNNMTLTNVINHSNGSVIFNAAKNMISNITKFLENVFQYIPMYSMIFVNQPRVFDFKSICERAFENEKQKFTNFYTYMCYRLEVYYEYVINNEYKNLGFDELLYPCAV